MHCDPLINPICLIPKLLGSGASAAAGGVLGGIAHAISDGVRWIVVNTAAWWVQIPSPDLASEPTIIRMQAWLLPVTAAVAVGAMIAAGLRVTISRRANPLLDVTGGLVTMAATATLGVVVPALLLKAGDAWSSWVLQASTGGHFGQRLAVVLALGGSAAPAVVMVFGVAAMLLALVQAVLMLFRQAALIVLAGALPLAAAGSAAPLTRPWIRRVSSWMLALICYKPAAAAIYAAAFTMIGSGHGVRTPFMGLVMLLLSVVALPALMKLITWATGSIASGGGGGGLLNAAAVGAIAVSSMRSGGSSAASAAQDQAAYLDARLGPPPSGTTADGGAPSAGGPSGGGQPSRSPAGASWTGSGAGPASGRSTTSNASAEAPAAAAPSTWASAGTPSAAPSGAADGPAAGNAGQSTAAAGGASGSATATGSAAGAASGAATGAAAAAGGPAGIAAAAATQAAQSAVRSATGAMEPKDEE